MCFLTWCQPSATPFANPPPRRLAAAPSPDAPAARRKQLRLQQRQPARPTPRAAHHVAALLAVRAHECTRRGRRWCGSREVEEPAPHSSVGSVVIGRHKWRGFDEQ